MKRALTLALAGVMTLGMGVGALADGDTSTTSDVSNMTLTKEYVVGASGNNESTFYYSITPYGVWNAGSSTGNAEGALYNVTNIPMPSFTNTNTVTIEGKTGVRNVTGKITVNAKDTDDLKTKTVGAVVNLPEYKSVGDFWYCIQEIDSAGTPIANSTIKNTGVIYGTNDKETTSQSSSNNGHTGTYYLHVQVVNNSEHTSLVRSVYLHKDAPVSTKTTAEYNQWAETNKNSAKVEKIRNEYYASKLSVTKSVIGNAADKDKRFEVTVVFTKPANTIINSDITYTAATSAATTATTTITIHGQNNNESNTGSGSEGAKWKSIDTNTVVNANTTGELTNTATFFIKSGETVTFNNIPYGVTYTVKETSPNGTSSADNSYTNMITVTGQNQTTAWSGKDHILDGAYTSANASITDSTTPDDDFNKYAKGSIATPATDAVTIINKKTTSVDVGVILDNAPYVAILAIAAGALMIFLLRRKTTIEE